MEEKNEVPFPQANDFNKVVKILIYAWWALGRYQTINPSLKSLNVIFRFYMPLMLLIENTHTTRSNSSLRFSSESLQF